MAWIRNRPTGLVYHDAAQAQPGYALVPQGAQALLFDARGRAVHTWQAPAPISYARLLPDGTLLCLLTDDPTQPPPIANGGIDRLVELDGASRVLFEHRDSRLHHDAWRLDDGSYHALGWEPLPGAVADGIRGGSAHPDDPPEMWGDVIVHVRRDGTSAPVWRAVDHLDPATHVLCPLDSRKEWTHANSIRITRDGHWLVSFRLTSVVAKIDRESGKPLWEWGAGNTSHQHDARELASGNVLIFDNGVHRLRAPGFARVLEVDPRSGEIVWQYLDPVVLAFQSFMAGGAQRLGNGNTFITEAATGRIFQVTPQGETVWEWVNPYLLQTSWGPTPVVFRAHWYEPGDPRLPR